jgi:hypothetical protein
MTKAAAMVETWRDSWFEEGTRLFYFLPQVTVDRILPRYRSETVEHHPRIRRTD